MNRTVEILKAFPSENKWMQTKFIQSEVPFVWKSSDMKIVHALIDIGFLSTISTQKITMAKRTISGDMFLQNIESKLESDKAAK